MKNLDDHYARIDAATRPALRDVRSVIPNGDDPRSKRFSVHVTCRTLRPFTPHVPREAIDREALKLECPTCAAPGGARCLSQAKDKMGAVLNGFHATRSHVATQKLRKKS